MIKQKKIVKEKKKYRRYKVVFLIDDNNDWIKKHLLVYNFGFKKKFGFKIEKKINKIKRKDIVFILGYTKILSNKFLKKNRYNLVVHESNLPKGKGFAPVQSQILKNQNKIPICLLEATEKVDSGKIYEKGYFNLSGKEIYQEIRYKQAQATFKIIKKFLKKFPNISCTKQIGKGNFFKKRFAKHHKLNINKTIKQQFNLLRIGNNDLFPSFFIYRGQKYILKIFKKDK